jgi:hypothetical protein
MFKAIKEFFLGKPVEVLAPNIEEQKNVVPVADGQMIVQVHEEPAQPIVEAKIDPVSVALDLEPIDFAATTTPVAAKKPRKPREPKTAAKQPAKEKAAKPVKAAAIKSAPKKTKLKKS